MVNTEKYNKDMRKLIDEFIFPHSDVIHDKYVFEDVHGKANIINYFGSHALRFIQGISMIEEKVELGKDWQVLEAGSVIPFYTFPFVTEYNWTVKCMDVGLSKNHIFKGYNIFFAHGNLCYDDLGKNKYDLITMCEVWEHLPCNLYKVKEKIIIALKPKGYLLCSYPLEADTVSLDVYNKDLDKNFGRFHGHLRQFSKESAEKFITELGIISNKTAPCPVSKGCYHILYRK